MNLSDAVLERDTFQFFLYLAVVENAFQGNELAFLKSLGKFGEVLPGIDAMPFGAVFIAAFVVLPVIELAEDLVKFNWSKIVKGALSVKKRQVELMEAEMKAPGRECAYIFDAQKKFAGK